MRRLAMAVVLLAAADALAATDTAWIEALGGRVERGPRGEVVGVVLGGTWVGDGDLARLRALPALARLDLAHTRITDEGLLQLGTMATVEVLDLSWAEQVTDAGIAHLKGWRKLRRLDLRGTKVTDTALEQLPHWPDLQALDVAFAQVTDAGVPQLAQAPGLRELAIGGNKMTEQALHVVEALPDLEVLDVAGEQRTDSGLWSIRVGDAGLEAIAAARRLRRLNLAGGRFSGRALGRLAGLGRLEVLDLHGASAVGDDAVETLSKLRRLRFVDLAGTALTPAGAERLRHALPRATVANR